MTNYDSVFAAAFQMPVSDRLRLIDELAATVPAEELPDDEVFPLSAEWMEEINRRSDEMDAGNAKLIPWEEARRELFKQVGLPGED
jgi:putative addiction module component (TIGR02574 family)